MLNPDRKAEVAGSHAVSTVNFEESIVEQFDFPDPLRIVDSTLRKTYFTAGQATSRLGFQRIAEALSDWASRTRV